MRMVGRGNPIWIVRRIMNTALICFLWLPNERPLHANLFPRKILSHPAFIVRFYAISQFSPNRARARRRFRCRRRDEISQLIKSQILRTGIFIIILWDDKSFSPNCNYCGYAQIQDERINEAVQCSFVCRILFCSQKFSSLVWR